MEASLLRQTLSVVATVVAMQLRSVELATDRVFMPKEPLSPTMCRSLRKPIFLASGSTKDVLGMYCHLSMPCPLHHSGLTYV